MEERTIRGIFEYNENEYPFVLEKRLLSIVQACRQYQKDFITKDELGNLHCVDKLGNLHGVTDRNEDIFLLNCRIFNPNLVEIGGSIQISLQGYILQTEPDDGFDRIDFCSPALRAFYPPCQAWTADNTDDYHITGLTLTSDDKIISKMSISIDDELLQCSLNIGRYFNFRPEDQYPLSIRPTFSIVFPKRKTSTDLGQYYLYALNFFSLVNFRANIPFDDIVLYRSNAKNGIEKIGNAIVFQPRGIEYTPDAYHSITFEDLGTTAFAMLFQDIAEQSLQKTYNPNFLPESRNEAITVNAARWLVTATSFEGEFNRKYKKYKAEHDSAFYELKKMLLNVIDEAVKQTNLPINDPANRHYQRFHSLIKHNDTTIKEKFQFCQRHFEAEIKDILKRYCNHAKVSLETDFATIYSRTRNDSAHGKMQRITAEGTITFQLLRCFIYLLILERAGIPREKREEILKKLF